MNYRKPFINSLWMLGAGIMLFSSVASSRPKDNIDITDGGDYPTSTTDPGTSNPDPSNGGPDNPDPNTSQQGKPPVDDTVKTSKINLRVEALSVRCDKGQEFFGGDEPFLMWAYSEMKSDGYSTSLGRVTDHFGITRPVGIKQGEFKNVGAGGVIFEGTLGNQEAIQGALIAMEEDEWRTWNDPYHEKIQDEVLHLIKRNRNMLESGVNGNTTRAATDNDYSRWAKSCWESCAPRSNVGPYTDVDDDIASQIPFRVTAQGKRSEDVVWQATGDGGSYTWRYRITRTPIEDPAPAPVTPTATPIPVIQPAPVVVPTATPIPVEMPTATPTVVPTATPKPTPTATTKPVPTATSKPTPTSTAKPTPTATTKPTTTKPTPKPSPTATPKPTATTKPTPKPTVKPANTTGQAPVIGDDLTTETAPAVEINHAFLPLKEFAIRVDKAAPSTRGDELEVFATLKNRTVGPQAINGGEIYAVATDADGIGLLKDNAFYRPEGEPERMWGNYEVPQDGELKVRFRITVPEGTSQLKKLTMWQTTSQPQSVDISSVVMPGVRPATNLSALKLKGGTDEFKPCGESLDVRFDGFRKARSGYYEALFTLKNTTDTGLHSDMIEFNGSWLDVNMWDASGIKERFYDVARPNGEKAVRLTVHHGLLSGEEVHLRYIFSSTRTVLKPTKVSVGDSASGTTVEWPVTVP